jgi:hypothetical protein
MQSVQFSGAEPFVVDDGLADALLQYAWELARYRRHDLVRIPARAVSGALVTVGLLLGPAPVLSTRTAPEGEPIADDGATDDLRRRTAVLRADMLGYIVPWPASGDDQVG